MPSLEEGEIQEETREPVNPNVVEGKRKCFASWKVHESQANNTYAYPLTRDASIIHDIKAASIAQYEHDDPTKLLEARRHSNWQDWENAMQEEIRRLNARNS